MMKRVLALALLFLFGWAVKSCGDSEIEWRKQRNVGIGADPDKLSLEQRKKYDDLRKKMQIDAGLIIMSAVNPKSVQFLSEFGMEDGWECFDFLAQNGFGGTTEVNMVISPSGKVYKYEKAADSQTPGFARAWNSHCAGKKPFVDNTHFIGP